MYRAQQIADWFLAYNEIKLSEDGGERISNLKLQKLLYYAQGSYLGLKGEKLFEDPIVAWKHGPVVSSVYYAYKNNASNGIELPNNFVPPRIDPETEDILKQVYDVFGQYSAWKLREMTHGEDPWRDTKQSDVISTDKIRDYFVREYITE